MLEFIIALLLSTALFVILVLTEEDEERVKQKINRELDHKFGKK